MDDDITCDLLLFFATSSEEKQLKRAANALNVPFKGKRHRVLGRYYRLGNVGDFRVFAVETKMGSLKYKGSASMAFACMEITKARLIVQLGMSFGVDSTRQKYGDVIISTSIIPYDYRTVPGNGAGYKVSYNEASWVFANKSLLRIFTDEINRGGYSHGIHVGGILSGNARIYSAVFRNELIAGVPTDEDSIVGGEMEGVGLVAVSPPDEPCWIIVKGISDFADEARDSVVAATREIACRNSAHFVLSALLNYRHS